MSTPHDKRMKNIVVVNSPSVKGCQKTKFSDGVVVVAIAVKRPPCPLRVHPSAGGE